MTAPGAVARSDLERVIAEDLYGERLWLRVGEATWSQLRARLKPDYYDDPRLPRHLIVLAMDMTFLHGRELLSFFTAGRDAQKAAALKDGITWKDYAAYGATKGQSRWFEDWGETLNLRLFHLRHNRPNPRRRLDTSAAKKGDPISHLGINQQVTAMADDVVRLWDEFREAIAAKGDERLVALLDRAKGEADKRAEAARSHIDGLLNLVP
jgi:hypothetical protein